MSIEPDVRAALKRAKDQLFADHRGDRNFTGCGVGFRRRDGKVTDEPVVIAMVVDKLPEGAVSRRRLIPKTLRVDGVSYGVDVVEAGPVYANGQASSERPDALTTTGPITGTFDPPIQGCGISNVNGDDSAVSTYGCVVQDNSTFEMGFLSAGHALGLLGAGTQGDSIIQPALVDGGTSADAFAKLTRYTSLDFSGETLEPVDAAFATLTNPGNWDYAVTQDLMEAIYQSHPAVGMCQASDGSGNAFLSRMDLTLSAMQVFLVGSSADETYVVAPYVGMYIEKVGRTSGYTASMVDAVDVTVNVSYGGAAAVTMSEMIWSQFFNIAGDSGAVACQGGAGRTFVLPPAAPCALLSGIETYYDIPTAGDNAMTNNFQDQFLSQSITGNLFINLVYMNSQVFIDRLTTDTGDGYNQATAQAYAQEYYAKYHDFIVTMLASPDSATLVLTQDTFDDMYTFWDFLVTSAADGGAGMLSTAEGQASFVFLVFILGNLVGLDYQQAVAYLDQASVYNDVYDLAAYPGTLELP